MYAAAGGASLASRQKRKNQAALNVKNKALLQQGLKDKLAATRASGLATPTKAQSRQFHNLPPTYLRTPQAQARKLSAGGYTNAQSRLLLPINESNPNLVDTQHHNYLHHQQQNQQLHHPTHQQQIHQQQHFQQQLHTRSTHGGGGAAADHPCTHNHPSHPCPQHPHHYNNSRFHHMPKSATLPIVSQSEPTPPATPATPTTTTTSSTKAGTGAAAGGLGGDGTLAGRTGTCTDQHQQYSIHIQVPTHDSIIVTPATPLASPGPPPTTPNHLERKCSFYRGKKLNTFDESLNKTTTITYSEDQLLQYSADEYHTAYNLPNGGGTAGKWVDSDYCDSEHRHMGVCTCDHVEVNKKEYL